jgi:hypothetical protein
MAIVTLDWSDGGTEERLTAEDTEERRRFSATFASSAVETNDASVAR